MARPIRNRNRDRLLGLCPKPQNPIIADDPSVIASKAKQSILTSFDFASTDTFIRRFGWAGYNPRGRLEDPALLNYDFLEDDLNESLAGEYTINKTLSLTGKEQVARLKVILPDDIPDEKRQNRAAVAKWAIGQSYALPDLRAMQYIYDHYEEAKTTTNPKLFEDMYAYRNSKGWARVFPLFLGSIVRNVDGDVLFPNLTMDVADRSARHLAEERLVRQ